MENLNNEGEKVILTKEEEQKFPGFFDEKTDTIEGKVEESVKLTAKAVEYGKVILLVSSLLASIIAFKSGSEKKGGCKELTIEQQGLVDEAGDYMRSPEKINQEIAYMGLKNAPFSRDIKVMELARPYLDSVINDYQDSIFVCLEHVKDVTTRGVRIKPDTTEYAQIREYLEREDFMITFDSLKKIDMQKEDHEVPGVLSDNILKLRNLEKLGLSRNGLTKLPENIGDLTKLQLVSLHQNKVEKLPKSFGKLNNLRTLDVDGNGLEQLPEDIGNRQKLEMLNAGGNKFTSLPKGFTKLKSLKKLVLYGNQLTELPEGMGELTNVEHLSLQNNDLGNLPESLYDMKKLTYLNLEKTGLTSLSPKIGDLGNLKALDISNNALNSIPQSIGKLRKLEMLIMSKRDIKNLPESVINLRKLTILQIRDGNLTATEKQELNDLFSQDIMITD